ncbi:MAG TPA: hypothetical protein VF754_00860 [Pyrinomonadaceae bacterium]
MKRRVYGEEMASEPSQFLNELPHDLMEDLSRGPSWLSFARGSHAAESRDVARALRGERGNERREPASRYGGKTYDSVDSIAEFFRQRGDKINQQTPPAQPSPPPSYKRPGASAPSRSSGGGGQQSASSASSSAAGQFAPGTHVRHPKYGRGLVLRREGTGDAAKLTVSFPGFGQKKLIEKYAGLEKA